MKYVFIYCTICMGNKYPNRYRLLYIILLVESTTERSIIVVVHIVVVVPNGRMVLAAVTEVFIHWRLI